MSRIFEHSLFSLSSCRFVPFVIISYFFLYIYMRRHCIIIVRDTQTTFDVFFAVNLCYVVGFTNKFYFIEYYMRVLRENNNNKNWGRRQSEGK